MGKREKKVYTLKNAVDIIIDSGNGTTCVVTERTLPFIFPSVIQRVEDVRLGEATYQGFTIHIERRNSENGRFQGRKSFAIGDTANVLPGLKTRITSKDRIGSEYQLALLLAGTVRALSELIESEATELKVNVNWILNTPPIYFSLVPRLYDLAGEYRVEYADRSYRLNTAIAHVYPEGAGAGAVYMLDEDGTFVNLEFAQGRTGVVDGGYRTIDSVIFEGPEMLANSARSLTNSITGVYQLMQQWAMDDFGEDWSEEECESNLRRGFAVLRETKERVELTDWVDDLGERLADLIESDVLQKQWNGLGDVDRVILAGGVSYMVAPYLKERFPRAVVLREEYPHTAQVPYELMNATGHLRLLKAERQTAR
jgi:hypothetical protein